MAEDKLTLFDKVDRVFTKAPMTKEVIGQDGFMILRALSMRPEYAIAVNNVQRYQGVLGWRVVVLLQHMFSEGERAPFLDYAKREQRYDRFTDRAIGILKGLFGVSRSRLEEYMPNLWVSEEELNLVWGLQDKK